MSIYDIFKINGKMTITAQINIKQIEIRDETDLQKKQKLRYELRVLECQREIKDLNNRIEQLRKRE